MRDRYRAAGGREVPLPKQLDTFDVQISWGGRWISLNDAETYRITADSRETSAVQWRKITATSPVAEGTYLVHAVRELVTEAVNIYVHGTDQFDLAINVANLEELFAQHTYRLRFFYDDYVETWNCSTADYTVVRNQAYTHNTMAGFQAQVPRFPTVSRDRRI